tara:strand:- start:102 stop:308 length:207 start_codon:yes stop_codon:yes gene_type:complete
VKLLKGDMVEFSGFFEKKIDDFNTQFLLDRSKKTGVVIDLDCTTAVILCEEEIFKIDVVNPMTFINKL